MKFTAFRASIMIVGGLFGALLAMLFSYLFDLNPAVKLVAYVAGIYSGIKEVYDYCNAKENKGKRISGFTKRSRLAYVVLSSAMTLIGIYVLVLIGRSGVIFFGTVLFFAATMFFIWNKED